VLVPLMQHFVNQHFQSATALESRVNLDLAVRPPKALGLVPTQLALHDHWHFGLAHLRIR
jgi:hypothetical protein